MRSLDRHTNKDVMLGYLGKIYPILAQKGTCILLGRYMRIYYSILGKFYVIMGTFYPILFEYSSNKHACSHFTAYYVIFNYMFIV